MNLLVVQTYLNPPNRHFKNTKKAAVILLTRAHCYATHYLSQIKLRLQIFSDLIVLN